METAPLSQLWNAGIPHPLSCLL